MIKYIAIGLLLSLSCHAYGQDPLIPTTTTEQRRLCLLALETQDTSDINNNCTCAVAYDLFLQLSLYCSEQQLTNIQLYDQQVIALIDPEYIGDTTMIDPNQDGKVTREEYRVWEKEWYEKRTGRLSWREVMEAYQ